MQGSDIGLKGFSDWVWFGILGIEACVLRVEVGELGFVGRRRVAHAFRFVRVWGFRLCTSGVSHRNAYRVGYMGSNRCGLRGVSISGLVLFSELRLLRLASLLLFVASLHVLLTRVFVFIWV